VQTIDYYKTGVKGAVTYSTFGCNVFQQDPPTPDKLTPDVTVTRKTEFGGSMTAPDGKQLRYWGFSDPNSPVAAERKIMYPSPTIRVRQGQIVHSKILVNKNAHTIHHHGIEPTTMNDGVGHVSFEAKGQYTYQFRPSSAGTFFYHCHRNTPLHFEMGMFGLLIVDPPEGPGRLHVGGPTYDVEKAWVFDDMDFRWHENLRDNHDAGLCGEDVGLNRFEPKYFFCSGVFPNKTLTDPRCVVNARVGQTVLLRILNASYSNLHIKCDEDWQWASCDGHGMGVFPWCGPRDFVIGDEFMLTPAMRYDMILKPKRTGTINVRTEFRHWITGDIQDNGKGVINTKVVVS
jgi:FtsP/CotA-like multicopper oxidase with cupredoxin domain